MHSDTPSPAHLPAPLLSTATLLHRTQETLGLLREVVQESSAEHWYERGKEASRDKDWESAAYAFEQCIQKDQYHWRATIQLAVTLAQQGNGDAAAKALVDAFELPYEIWWKFEYEIEHEVRLSSESVRNNWYVLKKSFCYAKSEDRNFSPWRLLIALEAAEHPRPIIFNLFLGLAITFRILDSRYGEQTVHLIESRFKVEIESSLAWHKVSNALLIDRTLYYTYEAYDFALYHYRDANAVFNLGNLRLKLAEAISRFTKYDQTHLLNPKYRYIHEKRHEIQHKLYDYNSILANYDKAIELDPTNPLFYERRGYLKNKLGNELGAIADYQKSFELNRM